MVIQVTGFLSNRAIILISLFTALTSVAAFIKIPFPYIPITLQTLVVFLCANLLGAIYGTMSQILYLSIGLMGIPVFAYGGGLGYIFQPTFGYLLSFPLCTFFIGFVLSLLLPKKERTDISPLKIFSIFGFANLTGLTIIYGIGFSYLYLNLKYSLYLNLENTSSFINMNIHDLVKIGILSPLPGDLIKLVLASYLAVKFKKIFNFQIS